MLDQIAAAAREAGRIILNESGARSYRKEGHNNFVTDADLHVQSMLMERLGAICPQAAFYAEEKENEALGEGYTWVVDPIDGTLNFMHGRRCSAVSIALLKNRQPEYGVIYRPFDDEMLTARRGMGACMNGNRIRVSEVPFENAMVAFGTAPYNSELADITMKKAGQFLLQAGDLRRTGSAAIDLSDVACGRSDVYFEMLLSPWDIAAGSLIVEEAGGIFCEFREKERTFDKKVAVLACNRLCCERALAILTENE